MMRLMGRGTRGNLPNSWERVVDWRKQKELRGEREKRVEKKERTVGEKWYLKKEKEFYSKT